MNIAIILVNNDFTTQIYTLYKNNAICDAKYLSKACYWITQYIIKNMYLESRKTKKIFLFSKIHEIITHSFKVIL